MKAYELMALAVKEPEKYENRKFKYVSGCTFQSGNPLWKTPMSVVFQHGNFFEADEPTKASYSVNFNITTELEEIPQPVPFLKAVKAYDEGKIIRCEIKIDNETQIHGYIADEDYKGHCCGFELVTESGGPVTTKEILEGVWYIE